jgi:hypothetical protein
MDDSDSESPTEGGGKKIIDEVRSRWWLMTQAPDRKVLVDKKHRNFGEQKERTVLWEGPYTVLQQISEMTYLIECAHGKLDVVHTDRLKRFCEPHADASQLTQRLVVAEETKVFDGPQQEAKIGLEDRDAAVLLDEGVRGDEFKWVYEVQELRQRRIKRSRSKLSGPQVEYLVKWKNWDDTHNSWERLEYLGGCREMLRQFDQAEVARDQTNRALRRGDMTELGMMMLGWSRG